MVEWIDDASACSGKHQGVAVFGTIWTGLHTVCDASPVQAHSSCRLHNTTIVIVMHSIGSVHIIVTAMLRMQGHSLQLLRQISISRHSLQCVCVNCML